MIEDYCTGMCINSVAVCCIELFSPLCHNTNTMNLSRSEGFVVPEELGAAELGRPVSSNRETPEGKTSTKIGRIGRPGIATYDTNRVIVTIFFFENVHRP